jgi:hypothetical protein
MYATDISYCSDQATAYTAGVQFLVGIGHSFFYFFRNVPGIARNPMAGLADRSNVACQSFPYISKQILSPAHGNFEEQIKVLEIKVLETSTFIINYYIIFNAYY